jgi:protein tyrosine phosphatase (PTP) superfamily phosphohydrolase (DUF442 family)
MRRLTRLLVIAPIALAGLLVTAYAVRWHWSTSTITPVIGQEVFRSGQPDEELLAEAKARGIGTVINLRGLNERERWYQREVAASAKLGLAVHDIRFQGLDSPPRLEVLRFASLLLNRNEPVLLHCADGWDRTGWASGVALALEGAPMDEVLAELSPLKGHICRRSECFLHGFFDEYAEWLERSGRAHSREAFRGWISDYAPRQYKATLRVLSDTPRTVRPGETIELPFEVINRSHLSWRTSGLERRVKAGMRIIGPYQQEVADPIAIFRTPNGPARDLSRLEFEREQIRPGERVTGTIAFTAPDRPGSYFAHLDLVEEHVHWFSDLGEAGIAFPLEVR